MTDPRIRRIQDFWNTLNPGRLDSLGEIYSPRVEFEDPLSKGRGLEELERHFGRIYRKLSPVSYEYGRSVASSDSLVIEWKMKSVLQPSKRPFELEGISFLELEAGTHLISRSKEYFDLGQGLYQHVPLLGTAIRIIRSKA